MVSKNGLWWSLVFALTLFVAVSGLLVALSETPWIDQVASYEIIALALQNKGRVPTIDKRDSQGYTGLMRAAQKEQYPIVKILIDHGASVNLKSKDKNSLQTALHLALQNAEYSPKESPKIVKLLIDKKADLFALDAGKIPAVHFIMNISNNYDLRKQIFDIILAFAKNDDERKKLVNVQNSDGNTMLHMMVQNRDRKGLKQFLKEYKQYVDPKIQNKKKLTVLGMARQTNVPEVTGVICNSGLWKCDQQFGEFQPLQANA